MARRRVSITAKLAGALAVPLAALSLVAGLEVGKSVGQAREIRRQTDLATASIGPSGLVNALQNERNYAGLWLLGAQNQVDLPVDSIEEARSETDAARKAFSDEIRSKGGAVARIYAPVLDALDGLDVLRANVDAYNGPRVVVLFNQTAEDSFVGYTQLVGGLIAQNSLLTAEVQDHALRQGVQLIDMSSQEIDRIARFVRVSLLAAVQGNGRLDDPSEVVEAASLETAARSNHQAILDLASRGPYAEAGKQLEVESAATGLLEMAPQMVESGVVDIPAMLDAISIDDDESYYGFLHNVSGILQDRADQLNAEAERNSRLYLLAAALVMAAAVGAILLVSRSIVRPLKDLTRQSISMAERRLPAVVRKVLDTPVGDDVEVPELAPVTVASNDEVSDVAETLNTVQSAAVSLAVDQAMLRRNVADAFINLARRNQNLLSRQLDFITDLERDETRTERLDNLFRLDHLATRMRRNAESLLVLAGTETSRQWTGPVRLQDIVRAALGEVEDYQRVVIRDLEGATIRGSATTDLAHLLAELIENSLRFSPPDRPVEISGRSRAGSYLLLVADDGMGMSRADLADANERLSHNSGFSLNSPRFLGHYVAGNLAARHGISVRLFQTPCAGVTAAVALPAPLLAPDDPSVKPAALSIPAPALGPGGPGRGTGSDVGVHLQPLAAIEVAAVAGPPRAAPVGPAAARSAPLRPAGAAPADAARARSAPATPPVPAAPVTPVTPAAPPVPPAPVAAAGDRPAAPGLTRRIPGTNMPSTGIAGLRRAPEAAPPPSADAPPPGSPDDVYQVLTNYVAGIDRGRRAHAEGPVAQGSLDA
jgi:signal transduction histidine kinase